MSAAGNFECSHKHHNFEQIVDAITGLSKSPLNNSTVVLTAVTTEVLVEKVVKGCENAVELVNEKDNWLFHVQNDLVDGSDQICLGSDIALEFGADHDPESTGLLQLLPIWTVP